MTNDNEVSKAKHFLDGMLKAIAITGASYCLSVPYNPI